MCINESIVPRWRDAALGWFLLRPALRDFGGQVGELGGRRVKSGIGRVKSSVYDFQKNA